MANVLIPLAKGFEELEAISIIDVLRRCGANVTIASLESKNLNVQSQGGVNLIADCALSQIDAQKFDLAVLPGGMEGTINLSNSKELKAVLEVLKNNNKILAAICAAPLALFKLGFLDNAAFTCYPSIEKQINNRNYDGSKIIVHDKNIITSQGPATALPFAFYLAQVLCGEEIANKVKQGMLVSVGIKG